MGYKTTIKSNVDKAFRLLKDLVVPVTLTDVNATFDFSTSTTSAINATKVISGLEVDKKKSKGDKNDSTVITKAMVFKSADFLEPSRYSTLTLPGNVVWKIVPPIVDDGFTVTVELVRSV
jgi:hypothetical protein